MLNRFQQPSANPGFKIRMTINMRFLKALLTAAAISLAILAPRDTSFAQSPPKAPPPKKATVEQELVHTEFGFFQAWKSKDIAYFREHIADNGVFWGEAGTFSRDQQLDEQQESAKACAVQGYSLSDFRVMPVATGAYLLTYSAEQYATCGGERVPVHMNGSSIYVSKNGQWQAIYRAEVPLKNQ
jgi:hypothetical protein